MPIFKSKGARSDVSPASSNLVFWRYLPRYLAAAILLSSCEPLIAPATSALSLRSDEECVVTVWMKAFISNAAGTLLTAPSAYAGFTAIKGPPGGTLWYLTDQRGFSNAISASARMHSAVVVGVPPSGYPTLKAIIHSVGETVGTSLEGACHMTGSTAGMSWSNFRTQASPPQYAMNLNGEASNPCEPFSPYIDYNGTLEIKNRRDASPQNVVVRFTGAVDEFPSFEMYATDGDTIVTLRKVSNAANTVSSLFGGAVVPFSGVATLCRHDQGQGS